MSWEPSADFDVVTAEVIRLYPGHRAELDALGNYAITIDKA